MTVDNNLLNSASTNIERYCIVLGIPSNLIDEAKQIFETYDDCLAVTNRLMEYYDSNVIFVNNRGNAGSLTKVIGFEPIRFSKSKNIRWVVGLSCPFEKFKEMIHYCFFFDMSSYMWWDPNRVCCSKNHKKSTSYVNTYLGPLNDTNGNTRVDISKDDPRWKQNEPNLLGDWHVEITYKEQMYDICYYNEDGSYEPIYGYQKFVDYANSIENQCDPNNIIIGQTYKLNMDVVKYIHDNFPFIAKFYEKICEGDINEVRIEEEAYSLTKIKEYRCHINGLYQWYNVLACMLIDDGNAVPASIKQLIDKLIELKDIYIEYNVYNGGGEGHNYEMTADNVTPMLRNGEYRIKLPWGSVSEDEANDLINHKKIKHPYPKQADGNIQSLFYIGNGTNYSYDSEMW